MKETELIFLSSASSVAWQNYPIPYAEFRKILHLGYNTVTGIAIFLLIIENLLHRQPCPECSSCPLNLHALESFQLNPVAQKRKKL